jgi:hypothetical protein
MPFLNSELQFSIKFISLDILFDVQRNKFIVLSFDTIRNEFKKRKLIMRLQNTNLLLPADQLFTIVFPECLLKL